MGYVKFAIIQTIIFFVLFYDLGVAYSWDNYVKAVVVGNNRILGEKEGRRFLATMQSYQRRLKKNRACDPRTVAATFPTTNRITTRNCASTSWPSPTNRQFVTRWDPKTYRYQNNYLTGAEAKFRKVRLGFFRKQDGGWYKRKGFTCNWKIGNEKSFNDVDCRRLDVTLKIGTYDVQVELLKDGSKFLETEHHQVQIKDLLIVAMGDSFGSGEGNPQVHIRDRNSPGGRSYRRHPALWMDPRCHRSLFASSGQASALLSDKYKSTSFSLVNVACSGAESSFGIVKPYKGKMSIGQVARSWKESARGIRPRPSELYRGHTNSIHSRPPLPKRTKPAPLDIPSQIDQMAQALGCDTNPAQCRKPDVIFMYIGVNDIQFSSQVVNLVLECMDDQSCTENQIKKVKNGIEQIKVHVEKFRSETLRRKLIDESKTKIYLVGYPNPLTRKGRSGRGYRYCNSKDLHGADGRAAFLDINLFGLGITAEEASFAEKNIMRPLNETLNNFAKKYANWQYINNENLMLGRGYCAERRFFNTHQDATNKQGLDQKDYFVDTFSCDPTKTGADCSDHIVEAHRISSGILHPNFFGHRAVAAKIIERIEEDFPQLR